jgi:hypothetical protein
MDVNFPVFATGVRIFRASNDVAIVGPLFMGPGSTQILVFFLVFVWTNTGKLRSIGQMPVIEERNSFVMMKFAFRVIFTRPPFSKWLPTKSSNCQ